MRKLKRRKWKKRPVISGGEVDWLGAGWSACGGCGVIKPEFEMDALVAREEFRRALGRWFVRHGKDYPWRRTREPYEVLVSEVMLQQTQVATVLGRDYYGRFLRAFPDVESLAAADDAALLKAWEGLGYYRRARMLRETARAVTGEHGGCFPEGLAELMKLPGIGRYTAGALRAFAFGLPAVLVDGNVKRVLARLMDFDEPVDATQGDKRLWAWAEELADSRRPAVHHAALMELGQTHCRPGAPDCGACPVSRFCRTREPAGLPVKTRSVTITDVDEHALWFGGSDGRLLLHREAGKRRTGLWKLPVRDADEIGDLPVIAEHRYAITRYRVRLVVHEASRGKIRLGPGDEWMQPDEVEALAMAAPFRRVVERLLGEMRNRM